MQWRMVGRRGRRATWTVVGDPAQSSWTDPDEAATARDEALGNRPRSRFELTVNYRNPAEIAVLADRVLALAMPGTRPPRCGAVHRPGAALHGGRGRTWARRCGREAERLLAEVDGTVGVVVAMSERARARGVAGRAGRPGGAAGQPGGKGPGVRRDAGRLTGADRRRVAGRSARAVRGADTCDAASHGAGRGSRPAGRGRRPGPAQRRSRRALRLPRVGNALRGRFVSLGVAPARSMPPGPTIAAASGHLPRGELAGRCHFFFPRLRARRPPGWRARRRVGRPRPDSLVMWKSFSETSRRLPDTWW